MKQFYGHHRRSVWSGLAAVVVAGLLISGCGGPETNAAFERARATYLAAESDPEVMEKAPVEMHEAKKTLERAREAEETAEKERLSYLAERQVQLAKASADQKTAEERMERLSRENEKVLLEARRKEAEQAKQEAESKAREVEVARREAMRLKQEAEERAREVEQARVKAEELKREAEARAREAEMARRQAEQARAEARQLERELTELQAKQTERGLVLTLGDVLFDTGKAELKVGALRSLDKLVAFLKENPERDVLIEGHTDSVGNENYNLALSQRRAEAVETALISRGISPRRILARGYGEGYPVASNETDAGRQQNRRVEIVILEEGVQGETMIR